jgi:Arc/MetJ-type ribon-helix-helix transcriptional regulator
MSRKIVVNNVRLPKEIVSWLDSLVLKRVFGSRSEAVREFSRDYVLRHRGGK